MTLSTVVTPFFLEMITKRQYKELNDPIPKINRYVPTENFQTFGRTLIQNSAQKSTYSQNMILLLRQ